MDLRPTQYEGIHAWDCKPGQLSIAGELMEHREEPTITILLDKYNFFINLNI